MEWFFAICSKNLFSALSFWASLFSCWPRLLILSGRDSGFYARPFQGTPLHEWARAYIHLLSCRVKPSSNETKCFQTFFSLRIVKGLRNQIERAVPVVKPRDKHLIKPRTRLLLEFMRRNTCLILISAGALDRSPIGLAHTRTAFMKIGPFDTCRSRSLCLSLSLLPQIRFLINARSKSVTSVHLSNRSS